MKKTVNIVIVDDLPEFVATVDRELRRAGLTFLAKRVATKEALLHELNCYYPDLVLSNHGLPSFDGGTALGLVREKRPDVPFIFVSTLPDEENASTLNSPSRGDVMRTPVSKLARTVRFALREANQRAKLREKELMVLTSRWLTRRASNHSRAGL
jgi:two-component system response regulator